MNEKIRKVIATIVGLALSISLFSGAALFASGTVNVGVSAPPTATNGQNIVVTGHISGLTGVTNGVIGYSVKIFYDTTKFTFVSCSTLYGSGSPEHFGINNVSGTLYIVYIDEFINGTPAPITTGDIFTATFKAIATGPAMFTIAGIDGLDDFSDTQSMVAATYEAPASVIVEDATVPSPTPIPTSTLSPTPTAVPTTPTPLPTTTPVPATPTPTPVPPTPTPVPPTPTPVNPNPTPVSATPTPTQVSPTPTPVPNGTSLTVTSASGAIGDNVSISVNISPNSDLSAADLRLSWDYSKLQFVSVVKGVIFNPLSIAVNTSNALSSGFANISCVDAWGVQASGSIVDFTYKILPAATTPVNLTLTISGDFIDDLYETIPCTIYQGHVDVTGGVPTTAPTPTPLPTTPTPIPTATPVPPTTTPTPIPTATTSPTAVKGNYAVISNESTSESSSAYTGTFSLAGSSSAEDTALDMSALRMDYVKPFNENIIAGSIKLNVQALFTVYNVGDTRTFYVYNIYTESYSQITATLKSSGTKSNVWVKTTDYNMSTTDANKITAEFDNNISPKITSVFGQPSDIDSDNKINILCFDIKDGFSGSGGYVAGYFDPSDLYANNYTNPYSNQMEVFYIDTYPAMGTGSTKDVTECYDTVAHEFQHMVNWNRNIFIENNAPESLNTNIWLQEALSEAASQVYSGQVSQSRIDYYNSSSTITSGSPLLKWTSTLDNYSLSYLFFQYLKLQVGIGDAVFTEIVLNTHNDYQAVEDVIKKYIDPNLTFGRFMTYFRVALLLKRPTGIYGFKGNAGFSSIAQKIYSGSAKSLYGGGAVVIASNPTTGLINIPANKGSTINYFIVQNQPVITLSSYPTTPTNQDITVTASTSAGTLNAISHTFTENGSFVFIATNIMGDITTRTVTITNIDKIAPSAPVLNLSTIQPTNSGVTVTISFPGDAAVKKFKTENGSWIDYSGPFVLYSNETIYAKSQDLAGNWSNIGIIGISNIDLTPPSTPQLSLSTYMLTNESIAVTITFPGDALVKKFKTENGSWINYSSPFTLYANDTIYAKCQDLAGNWSNIGSIVINNIDCDPPILTISDYIKTPTNQDITVFASTNEGSINTTGHIFTENGSFTFWALDAAGNSATKTITIANIDKVAPIISGVTNGGSYDSAIIGFNEGTATLNGRPCTNGMIVRTKGSYQLIVTDNATNTISADFIINITTYDYYNGNISGITILTKLTELENNIPVIQGETAKIFDASGTEIIGNSKDNTDAVTGMYLQTFSGDTVMSTKEIVIYGDVSGDGDISIIDLARIKSHLLKVDQLAGAYKSAGDISNKGSVTISDLLSVKKNLLGIHIIDQYTPAPVGLGAQIDFKGSSLGDPSYVPFNPEGGNHDLLVTYQNNTGEVQTTVFIVNVVKDGQLYSTYSIEKIFAASEEYSFAHTINIPATDDGSIVDVDFILVDSLVMMKTKHDTVKNSINNVR